MRILPLVGGIGIATAACGLLPTEGCACSPQVPRVRASGVVLALDAAPVEHAVLRFAVVAGTCEAPTGEDLNAGSPQSMTDAQGRYDHTMPVAVATRIVPACVHVMRISNGDTLGRGVVDVVLGVDAAQRPPHVRVDLVVP